MTRVLTKNAAPRQTSIKKKCTPEVQYTNSLINTLDANINLWHAYIHTQRFITWRIYFALKYCNIRLSSLPLYSLSYFNHKTEHNYSFKLFFLFLKSQAFSKTMSCKSTLFFFSTAEPSFQVALQKHNEPHKRTLFVHFQWQFLAFMVCFKSSNILNALSFESPSPLPHCSQDTREWVAEDC